MKKFLYFVVAVLVIVHLMGGWSEVRLKIDIWASNRECPINIDEGIDVTSIQRHGDYIEYVCRVDESELYSISNVKDQRMIKEMKNEMIKNFKDSNKSDADLKSITKLCKSCKVGIEFRLIGSRTKNEIPIRIEYYELP
ncbi:MAG: hypothetical protein J6Y82_03050 [Bacteroidales bacterium]|nr:hypothetical protein [Bacteroidales bacterium]